MEDEGITKGASTFYGLRPERQCDNNSNYVRVGLRGESGGSKLLLNSNNSDRKGLNFFSSPDIESTKRGNESILTKAMIDETKVSTDTSRKKLSINKEYTNTQNPSFSPSSTALYQPSSTQLESTPPQTQPSNSR